MKNNMKDLTLAETIAAIMVLVMVLESFKRLLLVQRTR